ncbi:MAG: hypothetical protein PHP14_02465 [Candidatus Pacebacteria bacterium]|nr:hypothetical protein [Candidatus Paceibacterota bacterium]MDD3808484.1 hypothetical protein [Candidatus Paceibacterota bacterium]
MIDSLIVILYIVFSIVLCLLLFLVFRRVALWYWKIDKAINLLERIADALEAEVVEEIEETE